MSTCHIFPGIYLEIYLSNQWALMVGRVFAKELHIPNSCIAPARTTPDTATNWRPVILALASVARTDPTEYLHDVG
jgi:hypothetical protein